MFYSRQDDSEAVCIQCIEWQLQCICESTEDEMNVENHKAQISISDRPVKSSLP